MKLKTKTKEKKKTQAHNKPLKLTGNIEDFFKAVVGKEVKQPKKK